MLTSDNKHVPSRCYYYLLDWNEQNEKSYIINYFKKERLKDLTYSEFWKLFNYATKTDNKKCQQTKNHQC